MSWSEPEIQEIVRFALNEDIGSGDITTARCVPSDRMAHGRFYARQDMVLAGIELLPIIYDLRGGDVAIELLFQSGDTVALGDVLATVRGSAQILLECERVSLNFLQRLSGVATLARRYADAVVGTGCQVLDTRKTTPGLRRLEKLAAAAGGVTNHRMGLYDAVLIKNNHITAAGGVRSALSRFTETNLPVEIEIRTRTELDEAIAAGAKHVLLDNLTPEQATAEIKYINGRLKVELSGNINLETVQSYAKTGADYVSAGAITHQAQSVDCNFRIELE